MDLLKRLYKKEIKPDAHHFFLVGVVTLFTLLRIPSLFEPDWYGDEAIYQIMGRAVLQGRLLYKEIWDNKPPVLYLYYAFVDGDLFLIKLLSLLFGIGAIIVFYLLAKMLFQKSHFSIILSTSFFSLLFGLPLLEGNIANAENFMLFPTLLSLFILLRINNRSKKIVPIYAGLLLSLSFLTKIVALFDFAAFVLIIFSLKHFDDNLKEVLKKCLNPYRFFNDTVYILIFAISYLIPILLTLLFFAATGGLADFMKATFSQNIGYVNYANQFIIPQGFLILKLLLLVIGIVVVQLIRKKIGPSGVVIFLWFLFSVFSSFFSGRPYTHYMLLALPAISFLLGYVFHKGRLAFFPAAIFLVAVCMFWFNFNFYKKIIPYYKNYYEYVFSRKSTEEYQSFFDRSTSRNYDVAKFITLNTSKNEEILVISNSAQIYYLANKLPPGRYIVAYHINFYHNAIEETQSAIVNKNPRFIISTDKSVMQNFLRGFHQKYSIQGVEIYEKNY